MAQLKHNKKRNVSLVYEFLVRKLSKCMLEADKSGYDCSLRMMKKYYGEGSVLASEKELFDVIVSTRGVTESVARRILSEVQSHAQLSDAAKIDIKKSNLIKEINHTFGRDFFSEFRVPEYRLLASIQMSIDACRSPAQLTESIQGIRVEEGIVQYMTTTGEYGVKTEMRSDVDQLVMTMVAKRFEEKYCNSNMNTKQKELLEKYVRTQVTGDSRQINRFIEEERVRISEGLKKARSLSEVKSDSVMMKKLDEAQKSWENPSKRHLDETVEDLMMYQKLIQEVESNDP